MTTPAHGFRSSALAGLHPDACTLTFWQAARERRLVVACCARCGECRMPPTALCPRCRGAEVTWRELPGTGTVFTFTVVRHPPIPELRDQVPYVIAVIDLDDASPARLIANVWTSDIDDVRIGARVRVLWDDVDDVTTIPRFELSGG